MIDTFTAHLFGNTSCPDSMTQSDSTLLTTTPAPSASQLKQERRGTDNAGNGEHLASWGYVVAIPVLLDGVEGQIADMQAVLSYLKESNAADSFLFQKADVDRLAVAGHSFGGATVLALAARDVRVKAVVEA